MTELPKPLYSGNSLSRFDNAVLVATLSPAEFTLRYACSRLEMCAIEFLNSDTIEENLAIIQLSFCFVWGRVLQLYNLPTSKRHCNDGPHKTRRCILSFRSADGSLRSITNYAMVSMPGDMATFPLQGIAYCRRSNLVNYYEVTETKPETGFSILSEHIHFILKHNFL